MTFKKRNIILAGILALSLAVRVLFSIDNAKVLFLDIEVYERDALTILDKGIWSLSAYHAPVFPLFMAGVYALFGRNLLYIYFAQCLLGTATTYLIYLISKSIGGSEKTALAAAGASLFYWPLQLYSGILLSETVFLFLLTLGVYVFLKALDRQKGWLFAAAGAVFGLSALTRSINMLLIFILPAVMLIYSHRKKILRALANSAVFILIFAAVMSPWAVRNYIKYGEFIPVDTLGGINLYIGNNERSGGFFVTLSDSDLHKAVREYTKDGRLGKVIEVNDKNLKEAAVTYIFEHPFTFVQLTLWRACLFATLDFRNVDWVLLEYISHHFLFHPVFVKPVIYFCNIAFFLAAIAGIPALVKKKRGVLVFGIIVYYLAVTSVFYIAQRYRLPVMPFMSVAAGFTAVSLSRLLKKARSLIASFSLF